MQQRNFSECASNRTAPSVNLFETFDLCNCSNGHLFFVPSLRWTSIQSFKSGRAFRVGPGSGLSLTNVSGRFRACPCIHKFYYTIRSNNFFLSWSFVLLTVVTSVSEVIVIFLQLILFASTTAFFCSLLGWVSHSFLEGDSREEISTRWHCAEKINHLRDSCL